MDEKKCYTNNDLSWKEFFSHETFRRRKFCLSFIQHFEGKRAATEAGFSPNTARNKATQLLNEPKIQEMLRELILEQEKRLQITADKILVASYEIATADIIGCFNEDGSLKNLKDIPPELRRCISSIDIDEIWDDVMTKDEDGNKSVKRELIGHTKKIKFWNKDKQIEFLGKHLKLINDFPAKEPLEVDFNVTVNHVDLEERLNCLDLSKN